jgi:hypothetical protein
MLDPTVSPGVVAVPGTLQWFARKRPGGPGVARDGGEWRMGAVTPGETLGTLYNIHVGSDKTKQHIVLPT